MPTWVSRASPKPTQANQSQSMACQLGPYNWAEKLLILQFVLVIFKKKCFFVVNIFGKTCQYWIFFRSSFEQFYWHTFRTTAQNCSMFTENCSKLVKTAFFNLQLFFVEQICWSSVLKTDHLTKQKHSNTTQNCFWKRFTEQIVNLFKKQVWGVSEELFFGGEQFSRHRTEKTAQKKRAFLIANLKSSFD